MACCDSCRMGRHHECQPVPDPEREHAWTVCCCLHDEEKAKRDAQAEALFGQARAAFDMGHDEGCIEKLRKVIALLDPPKAKVFQLRPVKGAPGAA